MHRHVHLIESLKGGRPVLGAPIIPKSNEDQIRELERYVSAPIAMLQFILDENKAWHDEMWKMTGEASDKYERTRKNWKS